MENLISDYLEYCKYRKNLNVKTTKAYRIDLHQYLDYVNLCGDNGLQRGTLDVYITELHKKYKPKSIKRKIASLKAFFHYLTYMEVLDDNPFAKIDIRFREPKLLPKAIPLHTVQAFLTALYVQKNRIKTDYQNQCLTRDIAVCELLFATGMRISELCSLTPENIDLENGTIRIFGKGSKERLLQIGHKDVIHALLEYKEAFSKQIDACGYFFVNRLHKPLSDQSVRFMINKYVDMAAINIHITPHMFRHTAATNMHQLTGDFYTVGEVLGHTLAGIGASLGMSMNFEAVTARYVDVRLERKKEVLDAYHAAIHPQPKQPDEQKAGRQKASREKQKRSAEIGR